MRALLSTAAALLALNFGATADALRTFDDDPAGAQPPGFVFAAARRAVPGRWTVERDGVNGFLSHLGELRSKTDFDLAVLESDRSTDLTATVRVRLVGGDREGGLFWHSQDANNFYSARLDLADQKIALDRVVRGNRIRIDGAEDLELDPTAWHVLSVHHEKDRIRVYLGGVKVFDAIDRTFREAGGVGLWASGESAVAFDDFHVENR